LRDNGFGPLLIGFLLYYCRFIDKHEVVSDQAEATPDNPAGERKREGREFSPRRDSGGAAVRRPTRSEPIVVALQPPVARLSRVLRRASREAILQKQKADSARSEALRLRYLATGQNLAFESSQVTGDPELAALLALASYDFARTNGGDLNEGRLYGSAEEALAGIDQAYTPVVMQHSEDVIALSVADSKLGFVDFRGSCVIRNLTDPESDLMIPSPPKSNTINTAYLDLASNRIAFGLDDHSLDIMSTDAPERARTLVGHTGLIRAVGFRDSEPSLLTGGRDATLIIWKNGDKKDVLELSSRVRAIATSKGSEAAIAGCDDGSTYVIEVGSGNHRLFKSRPGARVEAVAISEKAELVAIGYSDGITQLLSSDGSEIREVLGAGSVVDLAIDADHQMLVVASSGRKVIIYDLNVSNAQPREIDLDRPVKEMSIDKSTGGIFLYCSDHTLRKYPSGTSWYISQLQSRVNRQLTKEEWEVYVGADIPYYSFNPRLANQNAIEQ
jgi:hypothetical protein